MYRRQFLFSLSLTLPLAGCLSSKREISNGTATEGSTRTGTESATPTATPELASDTFLPVPRDGWQLERTEEEDWRYMGGVAGEHGFYVGPEGVPFEVIVLEVREDSDPARIARSWKCYPEWQVTLAYQGFALAAGSGTSQETGTPDVPKMTQTSVPNTSDDARELLSLSPQLSGEDVSNYEIEGC